MIPNSPRFPDAQGTSGRGDSLVGGKGGGNFVLDERVRAEVRAHPHPLLFVTVSGSHLYGFDSPNSDYDLRGAHLLPLRELVGLGAPSETLEIAREREGLSFDIVTHDARKFFGLLLKHSGHALEYTLSPLVVVSSPAHEELRVIVQRSISKGHGRHYFGYADHQWKFFARKAPHPVKPLLYAYHSLLTGLHLLRTGTWQPDGETLIAEHGSSLIADLVAIKRKQQEDQPIAENDVERYRREYERLQAVAREAEATSTLPDSMSANVREELNDLLLRLRLG